ncbi:MAG: hypothetical protein GY760_10420 [Deltaproteobacteria bacterium]|nr:hypothetical protein [Deltaproteobacteria bacterium]
MITLEKITLFKEETEGSTTVQTEDDTEQEEKRIIACKNCNHQISTVSEKTTVDDIHIHAFANPHGLLFEIGIYRTADGCALEGPFSDEFTWFPGYSWKIAICENCLVHMGWYFGSQSSSFFGIIADRIFEGIE